MFCVVNKCVTLVDLTTTKRRYILRGLLLIKIFQIRQKGKDAAVSRSAAPMLHVTNIPASFRPAIFFVAQFLSPAADKRNTLCISMMEHLGVGNKHQNISEHL